jgi:succinate-semialdehyde dehydrogenase / glutarate-semialdehyde dehydrogenase
MGVGSEVISRVLNAVPNELLIGGKWVATEQTLDVEDPSTGEVLTSVADASTEEGIAALDAAVEASEGWEQTDPR